ncbi:MAG: methionyl-tRNA formyltransferase, partial [Neisseriaceae bacterium]|nr:methionyl-tRNA formyltransferase [Neisseriaceae bacterium]
MKVIFAGTPPFAATALKAIAEEHEVVCVLTQPDRPAGRGMRLKPSAVKEMALKLNLAIRQPETLKNADIQAALLQ